MTREQAKTIVDELSDKKNLSSLERKQLIDALKILANKWSMPS